jgi:hypothetical protein
LLFSIHWLNMYWFQVWNFTSLSSLLSKLVIFVVLFSLAGFINLV